MICYLGLGSNLGDRHRHIEEAVRRLKATEGLSVLRSSSVYETKPQGGPEGQGYFLNLVLEVDCGLSPRELLLKLKKIEKEGGRQGGLPRWSAREIDVDILLCGDLCVQEEDLKIPHPLIQERSFVLKPLADLAPGWRHPATGKTVVEMLKAL